MMVPQSYPLVIEDSGETQWLVVGWEQSHTGVPFNDSISTYVWRP